MEFTRDPQNLYGRQPSTPSLWTSTKTKYVDYMQGATLAGIDEKQRDIKARHAAKNYFKYEAPLSCQSALALRCCRMDATPIAKRVNMLCTAGIVGGAIIGVGMSALISLASGPAFPATFASLVGPCTAWTTTSGFISGIGGSIEWTVSDNKQRFSEYITAVLENEPKYVEMRETSEKAKLGEVFREFLNGYTGEFTTEEKQQLHSIAVCSLTGQFPMIPVFSPYDLLRMHPYEYSAIVQRLDEKEKELGFLRSSAQICDDDGQIIGHDQDMLRRVTRLEASVDPCGGPYFKKHKLAYDLSYMETALPLLQKIHARLSRETPSFVDAQVLESVRVVIQFYKESSFCINAQVVENLKGDLVRLRIPEDDAKLLAESYLT
jgi:hypothetical protein